jgi:hypothetical protein
MNWLNAAPIPTAVVSSLKDDTVRLAVLGAVDCSNYTVSLKYFRNVCVQAVRPNFVIDCRRFRGTTRIKSLQTPL